ncbi:MAG: hypothetical protein ACXQTR_07055 [Candidatus Methanospirareceae archaeon]
MLADAEHALNKLIHILRDFFFYLVVGSVPIIYMYFLLGVCNNSNLFLTNFAKLKHGCVFAFALFVMCYCLGHALQPVGDLLVIRIYRWFFGSVIRPVAKLLKYDSEEVEKRKGAIDFIVKPNNDPQDLSDPIVLAEIQIFRAEPSVHAMFIERYNNLYHFRKNLSVALCVNGVLALLIPILRCCKEMVFFPYIFQCILFFFFSLILFSSCEKAYLKFLDRILCSLKPKVKVR